MGTALVCDSQGPHSELLALKLGKARDRSAVARSPHDLPRPHMEDGNSTCQSCHNTLKLILPCMQPGKEVLALARMLRKLTVKTVKTVRIIFVSLRLCPLDVQPSAPNRPISTSAMHTLHQSFGFFSKSPLTPFHSREP